MRALAGSAYRRVTSGRLRVLAYHDVSDPVAFRRHLETLQESYTAVGGSDVVEALTVGRALPNNAVWITFDDGYRSVVEHALPLLQEFEMTATLFVNPGTIEAGEPQWWDLLEAASAVDPDFARPLGLSGSLVELKSVDDGLRRDAVALARTLVPSAEIDRLARRVADLDCLETWTKAGFQIGNHTWDHPCFDRCTTAEQEAQVARAAEWLEKHGFSGSYPVFAYPNGDRTDAAESILPRYGILSACLFDHRLSSRTDGPLRISRLRIDAGAPVERFGDVVSGIHSLAFGALVHAGLRHRTPKSAVHTAASDVGVDR